MGHRGCTLGKWALPKSGPLSKETSSELKSVNCSLHDLKTDIQKELFPLEPERAWIALSGSFI